MDNEKGNGLVELSWELVDFEPSSEFPGFIPGHGMATEASEEKHSKDLMAFGFKREDSPWSP